MKTLLSCCALLFALPAWAADKARTQAELVEADLLIAGATESGWAAAIQAARMGVPRIVVVNDYEWLGGQFTLQALVAIDENRSEEEGKRRSRRRVASIPRSGLFRELMDGIEAHNLAQYGHPHPGNTYVMTTTRPVDAERVFRNILQPYVDRGQVTVYRHRYPVVAGRDDRGVRLRQVRFRSTKQDEPDLLVRAALTIDATDWGDVIQLAGAAFEYGPDLRETYGEPLAPVKREGYPLTDMNPLMYTAVLQRTEQDQSIQKPKHYDERRYSGCTNLTPEENRVLSWPHGFAKGGGMGYDFATEARRIVDPKFVKRPELNEWMMLGWYIQDYPLDVLPPHVNESLEALEPGASRKNIVVMSRRQRQLIYEDAKQHTLGMIYHMQHTLRDKLGDHPRALWRYRLSDEFGTPDRMPPMPYIREGLRLKAMYMMRQQDTTHLGDQSETYARAMVHDGILAWQFEYDYHPTGRTWLKGEAPGTAWRGYFKTGRQWGPPYTGLSVFPLRSMIPEKLDGLIGAQKNLGYSSIVSSAFRLHDQCIHVGQAAGAVAAFSLNDQVRPRDMPFDRGRLEQLREALCASLDGGIPMAIWPFRDLRPDHPAYQAANLLASGGMIPFAFDEVDFQPDDPASLEWRTAIRAATLTVKMSAPSVPSGLMTRGAFARSWWARVSKIPDRPIVRASADDADGDGIPDTEDALVLDPENASFPVERRANASDGLPDPLPVEVTARQVKGFNFAHAGAAASEGFITDTGIPFNLKRGFGWDRDMQSNNRHRRRFAESTRDAFAFTRDQAKWECVLPNGTYTVTVCSGDAAYPQPGQTIRVEGRPLFTESATPAGRFQEAQIEVEVKDGRLTIELGPQKPKTNTTINWLRLNQ